MSKKRQKLSVGQIAAVPLPQAGGYCRVVVARADATSARGDRGILLFAFGPKFKNLTSSCASRDDDLVPDRAIDIMDTSGILISRGEWPVLGQLPLERVRAWPFPRFIVYHDTFGEWQEVPYSEEKVTERFDIERVFVPENPKTRRPVLDESDARPIAQYGAVSAFGAGGHMEHALQGGWKWHPPFDHPSWGR
jgi:hypothetical protein